MLLLLLLLLLLFILNRRHKYKQFVLASNYTSMQLVYVAIIWAHHLDDLEMASPTTPGGRVSEIVNVIGQMDK